MGVLLPNASLGVRRRDGESRDAHGMPVPGAPGALLGPWPGRVRETPDGLWTLGVDPAGWPVRQHDYIAAADGRQWVVDTAQLIRNNADPVVDYIRVIAREAVPSGTEPGGARFVGR